MLLEQVPVFFFQILELLENACDLRRVVFGMAVWMLQQRVDGHDPGLVRSMMMLWPWFRL